jgi:hypothetical protein
VSYPLKLLNRSTQLETFEKRSILFKVKPPARRAYAPEGRAMILTTGIHGKYFED